MSEPSRRWSGERSVTPRVLLDVAGREVRVPPERGVVHLQFRRFAGCPVCDLHLRSFQRRHEEVAAAGVHEVAVFHSSAAALRRYGAHELPFPVVADPDRRLYREFGVESAPRALLDPRVWLSIVRAVTSYLWLVLRRRRQLPPVQPEGGRLGLPADFLIDAEGSVRAHRYGEHAYDQWSVDEVLALVRAPGAGSILALRHG